MIGLLKEYFDLWVYREFYRERLGTGLDLPTIYMKGYDRLCTSPIEPINQIYFISFISFIALGVGIIQTGLAFPQPQKVIPLRLYVFYGHPEWPADPGVWGTDIPWVHKKNKRPHERPKGPIIRKVIPLWAWERRPVKRIDIRPDRCKPRRPNDFEQVITTVTRLSRAGAPYNGTERGWVSETIGR